MTRLIDADALYEAMEVLGKDGGYSKVLQIIINAPVIEQGEPVAWKYTRRDGQVTATVNPAFALIVESDGFEVTPLYAKKG